MLTGAGGGQRLGLPVLRLAISLSGILAAWALLVALTGLPAYILPGPERVATALFERVDTLAFHAGITAIETLAGMALGCILGLTAALTLARFRSARLWLLPLLIASQAIPVFAIAPLLVLWLGYGLASKIAMATLIIFFPVAAACHDGLRRTDPLLLDQARSMGASPTAELFRVRLPAALPALASGLRLAAAIAPIGAVVGEWVGASAGLGYLMLHANGRMQTDLMFAALIVLAGMAVMLWLVTDRLARRLVPWQRESMAVDRPPPW